MSRRTAWARPPGPRPSSWPPAPPASGSRSRTLAYCSTSRTARSRDSQRISRSMRRSSLVSAGGSRRSLRSTPGSRSRRSMRTPSVTSSSALRKQGSTGSWTRWSLDGRSLPSPTARGYRLARRDDDRLSGGERGWVDRVRRRDRVDERARILRRRHLDGDGPERVARLNDVAAACHGFDVLATDGVAERGPPRNRDGDDGERRGHSAANTCSSHGTHGTERTFDGQGRSEHMFERVLPGCYR